MSGNISKRTGLLSTLTSDNLDYIADRINKNTVHNLSDASGKGSVRTVGANDTEAENAFAHGSGTTVIGDNSEASGKNTVAGGMGYKIISASDEIRNDDGTVTGIYELSTVEGLETGMIYSVRLSRARYKAGAIIEINGNKVTVNGYKYIAPYTEEEIAAAASEFFRANYLTIVGRPELGDMMVGFNTFAGGEECIAQDIDSFSFGWRNKSLGSFGASFGRDNTVGYAGLVGGRGNVVTGDNSFASGQNNTVKGGNSGVVGATNIVNEQAKHSFIAGNANGVLGAFTMVNGYGNGVDSAYTAASGYKNTVDIDSEAAHISGWQNRINSGSTGADATGKNNVIGENSVAAHAEGEGNTILNGVRAGHIEGYYNKVIGQAGHAQNYNTSAGSAAHAQNYKTEANAWGSSAAGLYTIADSNYQFVFGKYNIVDGSSKYAHIVGNGASDAARSNAHTLDWTGNAWYAGKVTAGVETTDEDGDLVLVSKGYVDDAVRSATPVKGVDYWTDEDKAEIYSYVEDAILGGAW